MKKDKKSSGTDKVEICISEKAWLKEVALVEHNDKEVGWYGVTKMNEDGVVEVADIFVPEQVVTGSDWEAEKESMADMQLDADVLAYLMDGHEINYMGHSHVNMGVSPSAQDVAYIQFLLDDAPSDTYHLYTNIRNKAGNVDGMVSVKVSGLGIMQTATHVTYIGASKTKPEIWAEKQTKIHVSNKPAYKPAVYPKHNGKGHTRGANFGLGHAPAYQYNQDVELDDDERLIHQEEMKWGGYGGR